MKSITRLCVTFILVLQVTAEDVNQRQKGKFNMTKKKEKVLLLMVLQLRSLQLKIIKPGVS